MAKNNSGNQCETNQLHNSFTEFDIWGTFHAIFCVKIIFLLHITGVKIFKNR